MVENFPICKMQPSSMTAWCYVGIMTTVQCWNYLHLQHCNSLLCSVLGCRQAVLSQCQPLCTYCKLHLDENKALAGLLLVASPRCSPQNSNNHACFLPSFGIQQGRTGSNPCAVRMGYTYPLPFCAKPQRK